MNHSAQLHDLDWYIDRAKERTGIASDRALGDAVGLSSMGVSGWRTRRAWPSDHHMIALSKMAGVDPVIGLADLGRWRTKDPAAVEMWVRLRDMLPPVLAVLVMIGGVMVSPRESGASVNAAAAASIHYATNGLG